MTDGEDFELMFTAHPDVAREILISDAFEGVPVTHIGECRAGDPVVQWLDGTTVMAHGYQHRLD